MIGDHIDYHNFSVLPMAIESSILLGLSIEQSSSNSDYGQIKFYNQDQENFADWTGRHSFEYGPALCRSHEWYHYILCSYHGILAKSLLNIEPESLLEHAKQLASDHELLSECNNKLKNLPTIKVLIRSDLPIASGLSSSSALVCASAVAISLLVNNGTYENLTESQNNELADDCSKFERLVGVHGGGMDQAVIMSAQQGYAKYVSFSPRLLCQNVKLPAGVVWLVSHCGHKYAKAATSGYNTRVLETKLGAALIVKMNISGHGIELDKTITLELVKRKLFADWSTEKIIEIIRTKVFKHKNSFSLSEICALLEINRQELISRFNTNEKFLDDLEGDQLQLLNRCEHVLEEADRTERFKMICETTADVVQLGELMTQSHFSLVDKYQCSHPALDELVTVALDAGALGSRLTGAGWGGCVVSLVEATKCDTVFNRLKEASKFTFRTEPQVGCEMIKLI